MPTICPTVKSDDSRCLTSLQTVPRAERRQALYIGRVDGGPVNRLWCIGRESPAASRARVKAFRSDMSFDLSCSQGKR